MPDFVISRWHRFSPVYCPSPSSIRREMYESLRRSIFLLYCLSCRVSMSHVRALAVKTSADEVSTDTVPLLNRWPLKSVRTSLSATLDPTVLRLEGDRRFILGVGCGSLVLLKPTSAHGLKAMLTEAICHSGLIKQEKNGNKQSNLNGILIKPQMIFSPLRSVLQPNHPADG